MLHKKNLRLASTCTTHYRSPWFFFFLHTSHSRDFILKFCTHTHHILAYLTIFRTPYSWCALISCLLQPQPEVLDYLHGLYVHYNFTSNEPKFHSTNNKKMNRPVPARESWCTEPWPTSTQLNSLVARYTAPSFLSVQSFFLPNCPEVG